MLEVAFNELSLDEKARSTDHAAMVFTNFFKLIDSINELKIAPVRIRTSVDLANRVISEKHFNLKDWLRTLGNDDRRRYISYIVQDPIITDNPYFSLGNINVVGFGYAFVNDLVSVSYPTNDKWNGEFYKITKEYLPNIDSDVIVVEVTVNHCLKKDNAITHSNWIIETYQNKQKVAGKNLLDFDDFWARRMLLFPWLEFALSVNQNIRIFGSIGSSDFKKAVRYLFSLNQHLLDINRGNHIFGEIPGDISNDGEATMNEYGDVRTFRCPDGRNRIFSMHVKLGDVRIYLWPLPNENKYIVGYIGPHLPTKKFN
jgi:hypothetical protein